MASFLALLAACYDSLLTKVPDTDPDVEVSPELVDFGVLAIGESATAEITVQNVGGTESTLTVQGAALTIEDPFAIRVPEGPLLLASGVSLTLSLTYAPSLMGDHATHLWVSSDDPDEPEVVTQVIGGLHGPALQVSPATIDLGEDWVGCELGATLALSNEGDAPLTVAGVLVEGDGFALSDAPSPPFVVAPGEEVPVGLAFVGPSEGDHAGALRVQSDDPRGERGATLVAAARAPTEHVERFALPAVPEVDLVLLVDQSDSMDDDEAALIEQLGALMDRLAATPVDWQLAVVTEDDGCATGGVIALADPEWRTRMAEAVGGAEGALSEALLALGALSLGEAAEGGCNEGLLRDSSFVHVVAVSDERDRDWTEWHTNVSAMRTAVGEPWRLVVSAIAGDLPWGCATEGNSAEAGYGYAQAAEATGGAYLSFCSDWADSVDVLAATTLSRTVFPLAATPEPDTLVVTVDGVDPGGWAWDVVRGAVVFDVAPASGSVVEARYTEEWACGG